jgi:hypothetical protein
MMPARIHSTMRRESSREWPLVAHLGDDARAARRFLQHAGLVHRPGERLLHVHVLARVHGGQRDDGVQVVGRGDDDRVDVLLLREHLAEVHVAPGLRVLLLHGEALGARTALVVLAAPDERALDVAEVDVAQGDDVLAHELLGVAHPHAAGAHDRDVERVAGRAEAATEHVARDDHGGGHRGRLTHEGAARDGPGHCRRVRRTPAAAAMIAASTAIIIRKRLARRVSQAA